MGRWAGARLNAAWLVVPNQGLRPLFLAVCTANRPQLFMFGMLTLAPCVQYDPMEAKNEARNQRLQGPKFKKSE